jgi:hypothetical protein
MLRLAAAILAGVAVAIAAVLVTALTSPESTLEFGGAGKIYSSRHGLPTANVRGALSWQDDAFVVGPLTANPLLERLVVKTEGR